MTTPLLQHAAAKSLADWYAMVASGDFDALPSIVHPEAVFRSPMAHSPYGPAAAVVLVLRTVMTVFEDFEYQRELVTDDGLSLVLEFSARVGDKRMRGIDLIRFDEHGLILEFEVMVRPMSGLQALGTEMAARLSRQLPAFKLKS